MPESDVADLPMYTTAEAARYVGMSAPTVGRWRAGYTYPTASGARRSKAVTGGRASGLLSFNELLEVAVVAAARRAVPMQAIRRAVDAAKIIYKVDRPLILIEFKHDGRHLFTKELEGALPRYVNLSRAGQTAWEHVQDVLADLDYDGGTLARRWWPAGRDTPIVIDPRVSFGRPYIVHRGISTDAIRGRFSAGESIDLIADDLDVTEAEAEAAIRFELPAAA
jgi:uncharacterized protein (DUF433 family)